MIRRWSRDLTSVGAVAIVGAVCWLPGLTLSADGPTNARPASAASRVADDACALLSPADIVKATTLKVGTGTAGTPIPGVLGRCSWLGDGDTKIIVVLADAQHMGTTVAASERSGGESVPALGTRAVGSKGAGFTGGGYIVNVLDAKGGFGVSILGHEGTRDRAVALAKIVESRR
jgi:hypothetical protein